jgi:hypothetical protein
MDVMKGKSQRLDIFCSNGFQPVEIIRPTVLECRRHGTFLITLLPDNMNRTYGSQAR